MAIVSLLQAKSWLLWVPTQLINFRYIPESYRLPVVSGVALVWNVYLAMVSARKLSTEKEEELTPAAAL